MEVVHVVRHQRYVRVEVIVQHVVVVQQDVEHENTLVHDEYLMVLLVQTYLQNVMEQVHVAHVHQLVLYDNIVQHEVQVVVIVQISQRIHLIQVMERQVIVVGLVIVDIIKNEVVVYLIQRV